MVNGVNLLTLAHQLTHPTTSNRHIFIQMEKHFTIVQMVNKVWEVMIYFTVKKQENWSNPINMGFPLNTVDDDFFLQQVLTVKEAIMHQTTKEGYGGNDLYMVKLKNTITDPVTILKGHVDKGENTTLPDGITIWVHEEGSDLESMRFTPNKNLCFHTRSM